MRSIWPISLVLLTSPFGALGALVAVLERLVGDSGAGGKWVASPFLAAIELHQRTTEKSV